MTRTLTPLVTTNVADGPTSSYNPAWSPDGSRIAPAEQTWPGFAQVFTVDPDGRNRRLVSMTAEWSIRPNWGRAPR